MSLPTELQPLCSEFDRERPNVLVVVGAGVSLGATNETRASWQGLLEHGVATLRDKSFWDEETANANLTLVRQAFESDFDLDEVLSRAESIVKALGAPDGPHYASWLATAVGSLKAQADRAATLHAVSELEQAGALILTTNYDDLLSDVTGLAPVTWQEHREFLRVLNREREGILHLHGHWHEPASVVLGGKSYERILAKAELQDLFKSIWLHWSWLYIGCGNGLEDPNVGQLLRWGQAAFGDSARKHYFLARSEVAAALTTRPDKPANLVAVGYRDHSDLPNHLRWLTPRQRSWPFVELGPTSGPVRHPSTSPLDVPLPSWHELVDGEVPMISSDAVVAAALRTHGWALIYDVASVGKTTLALRMAATESGRPAFYLDLARVDASSEDEWGAIRSAVRRLAHSQALIVLDNAHCAPQLAREAWDWWLRLPRSSHLLLIATRIQYTAGIAGDDSLAVVEHSANPAITVRPTAAELRSILNCIAARICGRRVELQPPDSAVAAWHATFGCELGAFATAATGNHHRLLQGDWNLPTSAAAEWMRNRHIHSLTREEYENLVCLSVFAAQFPELDVAEFGLPHPGSMKTLLRRGLIERREHGRDRHRSYAMREPDWGALLLAAVDPPPDTETVTLDAACRHAGMALFLGSRLFRREDNAGLSKLWKRLCDPRVSPRFIEQILSMPLGYSLLAVAAAKHEWPELGNRLFDAWQAEPHRLAERAFETQLGSVASFIEEAAKQKRTTLVDGLLTALEADPARLGKRAFDTPLHFLCSFIDMAARQKRTSLADAVWAALEADPARLAEQAFDTPPHFLCSFIDVAARQKRTTLADAVWAALEADPARFAERAFDAPLRFLCSFIEKAARGKRKTLVNAIWAALEASPARLAERVFDEKLDFAGWFMAMVAKRKRLTLVRALWTSLETGSDRLAERAFETPLNDVASFIEEAAKQKRSTLVNALWAALEAGSDRLAERAFETPLGGIASFIEKAAKQKTSSLVDALWTSLEAGSDRLAERALMPETALGDITAFFKEAAKEKRSTLLDTLWGALEEGPDRLAERALETPLGNVASFIELAAKQKRSTLVNALWASLEADPGRLAERAFETPLNDVASFIEEAAKQKRSALVEALWAALQKDPDRLQICVSKLGARNLRGFLVRAPEAIGRLAIAKLDASDWATGSRQGKQVFWGAPRLAAQFAALGREDLAASMQRHLLRSAHAHWFEAPSGAMLDVAMLLSSVGEAEHQHVEAFVDRVCTPTWLARQYANDRDSLLANALALLAMSQAPSILRRFWVPELSRRVGSAIAGLAIAEGKDLCGCVQFLGAAVLIGKPMPREPFAAAHIDRIARLPSDVLQHPPEFDGIEAHQRNLWLGLRVIASLCDKPPPVGVAVIDDTLRRWQINLQNSMMASEHAPSRLEGSMVAWLQACAHEGTGVLLPCQEPLWLCAGFGRDPRLRDDPRVPLDIGL